MASSTTSIDLITQKVRRVLEYITLNYKPTEGADIIPIDFSKLMGKSQDPVISFLGLSLGCSESSKQWPKLEDIGEGRNYDGVNSGAKKALDSNVFSVGECQGTPSYVTWIGQQYPTRIFLEEVITRILRNYNLCKALPDFSLSSFLQKLPIPLEKCIDGCTKPIVSASAEHSKLDSEFFKDQICHGKTVAINFPSKGNPGWIDHSYVGSTVIFKPPADSDNSLAGFALYVGYETHEHGSDQFVKNEKSAEMICNFYTDKGLQHTFVVKNMKGSEAGQRGQFVCVPRNCFDGKLKEASFLEASVSTKPDMVVKRCGMHLISKQDTAKFATDLIQTAGEYLLKDSKVCPNCKHVL